LTALYREGKRLSSGSLTAIGSGIKSVAHLTLEAKAHVESADVVLICSADAVTDAYLRDLNPNIEDLHVYYGIDVPRRQTYQAMTARMVEMVRRGLDVVVVFYGHPGVFVDPTFAAIIEVREMGLPAVMLPGISAEDCMIADLEVDPANQGMQTYEATYYLTRNIQIDVRVPLVLWQVALVGDGTYPEGGFDSRNLGILVERLQGLYSNDHQVVIYEAAQHPLAKARIWPVKLSELGPEHVTGISTMFVPPKEPAYIDQEMVKRLQAEPPSVRSSDPKGATS
jgi:uncharacterized protein YabN with tetrapyrrole methylase and pyrophosphatase domain